MGIKETIHFYRNHPLLLSFLGLLKKIQFPFMGGLPVYWVVVFFFRNLKKESINLRASSIAFNLFLSLFPSLIFLFTLLPYIPIKDLHKEILVFLQTLMPSSAFQTIDETLKDIMENRSGSLLSFGLLGALYFGSNGVYSLMEAYNKRDKRSFWKRKVIAIGLTITLGILLVAVLSLFLLTQFSAEMLIYYTNINDYVLYYAVQITQWVMIFILLFGATTILYRHGDTRSERWRFIFPGAFLASILTLMTSLGYALYVEKWGHYSRLYGSLGAMIITMLWLYFNAMVLIIGHEFNRSLMHARLAMLRKEMQ